jgi:hypothetical protein
MFDNKEEKEKKKSDTKRLESIKNFQPRDAMEMREKALSRMLDAYFESPWNWILADLTPAECDEVKRKVMIAKTNPKMKTKDITLKELIEIEVAMIGPRKGKNIKNFNYLFRLLAQQGADSEDPETRWKKFKRAITGGKP